MTIELGLARQIDAQTFGEPGQRTFRLRIIGSRDESAALWMEKEQFQALSMALTQVLSQLGREQEADLAPIVGFPEVPDHDFRTGRMGIGFDTSNGTVVLQTFSPEDDNEPALTVAIAPGHCSSLNRQLRQVVAAGRPLCPLCGAPAGPEGHACIRANGHSRQPVPQDDTEES